jgi:hypothetical protein
VERFAGKIQTLLHSTQHFFHYRECKNKLINGEVAQKIKQQRGPPPQMYKNEADQNTELQ